MFRIIIITIVCAIVFDFSAISQNKNEKKAERAYENFLYKRAISLFEKVEEPTPEAIRHLADCYIKAQQYESLEGIYQTLISTESYNAEDLWNYAEAVKYNQKYEKYDTIINLYFDKYENSERTKQLKSESASFNKILNSEPRFSIYSSNANTAEQEFSLNYYGDSVIFIGTGSNQSLSREVWSVNQKPFLDLFVGVPSDSGKIINIQSFDSKIESNYHYGPVSFNNDFTNLIFTRNDADASKDGVIRLQLYFSEFLGKEWSKEVPLKINSPDYSVGHPAIDSKNKRLYFASDMPGSYGGTDIYYCNYSENWELSTPINLGPKINTPSNELFPYYHQNGYLLFSSNGHLSLGGLDNYLARFDPLNQQILFVQNLGKPINSNYDDFSLVMDKEMASGYFSSDRIGGKGSDDIYYFFTKEEELQQPYLINLIVSLPNGDTTYDYSYKLSQNIIKTELNKHLGDTIPRFNVSPGEVKLNVEKMGFHNDSLTFTILENTFEYNAVIKLQKIQYPTLKLLAKDSETKNVIDDVKFSFFTINLEDTLNAEGSLTYEFLENFDSISVSIIAKAVGYEKKQITKAIFSENGIDQIIIMELNKSPVTILEDSIKPVVAQTNDTKESIDQKDEEVIELGPIYFDFDEATITEKSKLIIDEYILLLKNNSNWRLEVKSYTDCQGAEDYNLILSNKRAKETVSYIKSKIVNKERVFGNGYGEQNPNIDCKCDEEKPICTTDQQRQNRRSEFFIIK